MFELWLICNDIIIPSYQDHNYFHCQDQFPETYNYAPLHPVENHLWQSPENLGEISGVAVDPSGNPVIFHRGDRTWNYE